MSLRGPEHWAPIEFEPQSLGAGSYVVTKRDDELYAESLPLEALERINRLCDAFESAWQGGREPRIEDALGAIEGAERRSLLRKLLRLELDCRRRSGTMPAVEEYHARFPEDVAVVNAAFDELPRTPTTQTNPSAASAQRVRQAKQSRRPFAEIATESPSPEAAPPQSIGRYRIEKVLGRGAFGVVYLALDAQLDRRVAIKVPHVGLVSQPEDARAYLAEARTVANLDHPHIVPVHDVGSTDKFPCYIVSKYVEGTDLSTRLKQSRLSYNEAAELVATVAEALHYAHKQGLIHRDVKPGNILIGKNGQPYVVDFGLALREENVGKGARYAGTAPI